MTDESDVFISYSSNDLAAVRQLVDALKLQDLEVWFDKDKLEPGARVVRRVEDAITKTSAVVVAMGASGQGLWQDQEIDAALHLAVERGKKVIPVLLPGAPDGKVAMSPFLAGRRWLDLRRGIHADGLGELRWGITSCKPPGGKTQHDTFPTRRGWIPNQAKRLPLSSRIMFAFCLLLSGLLVVLWNPWKTAPNNHRVIPGFTFLRFQEYQCGSIAHRIAGREGDVPSQIHFLSSSGAG